MRRPIYTTDARKNLIEIALNIAERSGSRDAGDAFVAKLEARCERLAGLSGLMGTARSELRPGIRSVAHNNYLIFFHYTDDGLEIVNILPGRRDLEAYFADDDSPHSH